MSRQRHTGSRKLTAVNVVVVNHHALNCRQVISQSGLLAIFMNTFANTISGRAIGDQGLIRLSRCIQRITICCGNCDATGVVAPTVSIT